MAGIKVRRTLDDRGFKKYMAFCESLKDGSNDALIDTFKYKFAVMEGRIVPKGAKKTKPLTEASGLGMGDFEKVFQGLVGAFLPHLDKEEQDFLGCVCNVIDEKINGGDMDGAMDALKGAVRDAGGDPDAYEDDSDEAEEEEEEDDGCPDGECKVDGECVPCKDKPEPKEECGDKPDVECNCGKKLQENLQYIDPSSSMLREGDVSYDPENRYMDSSPIYPEEGDPEELDFYHGEAASPVGGYSAEPVDPSVDYDSIADDLLRDAGYSDLTVGRGGVHGRNRRFLSH